MKKTIEVRLKTLLKERGIEQKELAERAELTERTVSELVNNKTKRYPKDVLEKIAMALNIDDINEIITLINEESDTE